MEAVASPIQETLQRLADLYKFDLGDQERVRPMGPTYMSHEEFAAKHPAKEAYAKELERGQRKDYENRHGSLDGYAPSRIFPCPGTFVFDDPDPDMNIWTVICDDCGTRFGVRRVDVDRDFALEAALERAHIPAKFLGKDMRELPGQKNARNLIRDWLQTWRPGNEAFRLPAPALYGLPGRGKTHLLSIAMERLVRQYRLNAVYWSIAELLDKLRDSYDTKESSPDWERALNCELLLLDDIGADKPSPWAVEKFNTLIEVRFRNERATLISSNIPPTEWTAHFGERTTSRLLGLTMPIEVEGEDVRALIGGTPRGIDPFTGEVIGAAA